MKCMLMGYGLQENERKTEFFFGFHSQLKCLLLHQPQHIQEPIFRGKELDADADIKGCFFFFFYLSHSFHLKLKVSIGAGFNLLPFQNSKV